MLDKTEKGLNTKELQCLVLVFIAVCATIRDISLHLLSRHEVMGNLSSVDADKKEKYFSIMWKV